LFCFQISRNDIFPKYICLACYESLVNLEEFKKKAEDSLKTYEDEKNQVITIDSAEVVTNNRPLTTVNLTVDGKNGKESPVITVTKVQIQEPESVKSEKSQPESQQKPQNTRVNPWEVGHPCERCFQPFDRFEFFKSAPKVQKKIPIVNKMRIFKCSKCNKAYSNKKLLEDHEELHMDENLLDNLAVEMEEFDLTEDLLPDPPNNKSLQCDICPYKFDNLRALGVHKSFHRRRGEVGNIVHSTPARKDETIDKNDGLFNCSKCSRKFFTNHGLLIHSKIHLKNHSRRKRKSSGSSEGQPSEKTVKLPVPTTTEESNDLNIKLFSCWFANCDKSFLSRYDIFFF
jgi:hypothetical protein